MNLTSLFVLLIGFAMSFRGIASPVMIEDAKNEWTIAVTELEKLDGMTLTTAAQINRKNELINDEWKKRSVYFDLLGRSFLKREKKAGQILEEINSRKNAKSLLGTFTLSLINSSVDILKKSTNADIRSLMKKYQNVYGDNSIPLFRLTGAYTQQDSPTDLKGGFHRGVRSIFMDLERTSNDEFLFIFMHELYHALDEELLESSSFFSDRDRFEDVMELSLEYENLVELEPKKLNLLDQWVTAGLNRNLFAEWRDWLFCFSVYESGLKEGLWGSIPFVEEVLAHKERDEKLPYFVYRYLDERSTLNEKSLMGRKIIKEMVEKKRIEFYDHLRD